MFWRFGDLKDLSRFHHRKFLWKRSEKPIVLHSKFGIAKNTKIPRRSRIIEKCQYFLKNMFDLVWSIYVPRCFLRFSDFQVFRFDHRKMLWTLSEKQIVFDPPDFETDKIKLSSTCLMSGSINHFWSSKMLRYGK